MNYLREDLKFSAIAAAVLAIPLVWLFGAFWNPHGSFGSDLLFMVGTIGIAPLLYVSASLAPAIGFFAFLLGCLAQFAYFTAILFAFKRGWRALTAWR